MNNILNDVFQIFKDIVITTYPSIRIKRYFKINIDVEEKEDQVELIKNHHLGKTCHGGINDIYTKL